MIKPLNKIEKLIDELCPEGVEVKELGAVCDLKNGYTLMRDYLGNENKWLQ